MKRKGHDDCWRYLHCNYRYHDSAIISYFYLASPTNQCLPPLYTKCFSWGVEWPITSVSIPQTMGWFAQRKGWSTYHPMWLEALAMLGWRCYEKSHGTKTQELKVMSWLNVHKPNHEFNLEGNDGDSSKRTLDNHSITVTNHKMQNELGSSYHYN